MAETITRYETQAVLDAERERFPGEEETLSAICLSGGGIRSAAFCLGVIQAFAAREMLSQFHYLSTVSGGGYIGGWLTRCIKAWGGDVEKAEAHLNIYQDIRSSPKPGPAAQAMLVRKEPIEPRELDTLRRYTNFLTPSPGFASADTWAGIVLWLRNTLINWAVFLPLALTICSVPIIYVGLVCLLGAVPFNLPFAAIPIIMLWGAGLGCLFLTNLQVCRHLPTHDFFRVHPKPRSIVTGLTGHDVWMKIGIFSLGWSFLVPLAMAPVLSPPQSSGPAHAVFFKQPAPPVTLAPKADAAKPAACPAPPVAARPIPTGDCRPSARHIFSRQIFGGSRLILLPALNWLVCMLAYGLAGRLNYIDRKRQIHAAVRAIYRNKAKNRRLTPQERRAFKAERKVEKTIFIKNLPAWAVASLISSLLLLIGLCLTYHRSVYWIALTGPLWVVLAELIRSTAYVAMRRHGLFSDLDREWLARLSGNKLRVAIAACTIGAGAIFLPRLVLDDWLGTYATILAFTSGPVAALIGKLPLTNFTHGATGGDTPFWQKPATLVAALAALFFVVILMLCGRLVVVLTELAEGLTMPWLGLYHCPSSPLRDYAGLVATTIMLALMFAALAWAIDLAVNLNRFSMHAVYRNRLIRAFLGTASSAHYDAGERSQTSGPPDETPDRVPDAFTGFAPTDNIRMADAFERTGHPKLNRLFPVINVTLNRTSGHDTARAERKGEPFTITPLHCGCAVLNNRKGAYIQTIDYAGGEQENGPEDKKKGLTLGTAMAISGAAVSPNMGYNSSPFAAFLMTLFNVRLGAWLPNPATQQLVKPERDFFAQAGPKFAIPTLMRELSGQTDDTGPYVYLSDGGHFDNLGLYEMLRRACAYIVVVDAGADGKYGYFDLGHALQMASVDLGIQVTFTPAIKPVIELLSMGAAYARVTYPPKMPGGPRATGQIIYIKPWLPPDAPIELLAYKGIKPSFPHEPTSDQFFTESDFESYRGLGAYLTNNLLTNNFAEAPHFSIAELFKRTEHIATKQPPVPPSGKNQHSTPPQRRAR